MSYSFPSLQESLKRKAAGYVSYGNRRPAKSARTLGDNEDTSDSDDDFGDDGSGDDDWRDSAPPQVRSRSGIAMENVFSNQSLLERVLLNVPMRDVLVNAVRVCKAFEATIESSRPLQRLLYLSPKARPITYISGRLRPGTQQTRKDSFFCDVVQVDGEWYKRVGDVRCIEGGHVLEVNPFTNIVWPAPRESPDGEDLETESDQECTEIEEEQRFRGPYKKFDSDYQPKGEDPYGCSGMLDLAFFLNLHPTHYNKKGSRRRGVDYPEASWRRMFLTQPPITGSFCTACPGGRKLYATELLNPRGLTMEDVINHRELHMGKDSPDHKHTGYCNRFQMKIGVVDCTVKEREHTEDGG